MEVTFNSDDDLPLKAMKMNNIVILIRSLFNKH